MAGGCCALADASAMAGGRVDAGRSVAADGCLAAVGGAQAGHIHIVHKGCRRSPAFTHNHHQ